MDLRKIRTETILYSLIFILAFWIRTFDLGKAPLSDGEATWALQAFQIARPDPAQLLVIGPQPLAVFLTSLVFNFFEPSNFLARFWPALFGSLLVIAPFFFRHLLGQTPALLMAAGLALDPGLISISRQAGAPMMAACLFVFALGMWVTQRSLLAGILAGLGLMAGPSIFIGVLIGGLTWFFARRVLATQPAQQSENNNSKNVRQATLAGAVTILLAGTFFWRYPQGLSALANTIPTFIAGFSQAANVPVTQLLAASILYQPFAWLFAGFAVVRFLKNRLISSERLPDSLLVSLLGAVISLLIISLYPARAAGDLVWFHIFLWSLAATELPHWLVRGELPALSAVQAGLLVIMFAMLWNILLANYQVSATAGLSWNVMRALVISGIVGLGGLTSILIAYGWSWPVSRTGLVGGTILASLIYSTFAIWSASQIRPNSPVELWSPRQVTADPRFFHDTLQDLSQWERGMPGDLDIVSVVDRPSLRWVLRDFANIRFLQSNPYWRNPCAHHHTFARGPAGCKSRLPGSGLPLVSFSRLGRRSTYRFYILVYCAQSSGCPGIDHPLG